MKFDKESFRKLVGCENIETRGGSYVVLCLRDEGENRVVTLGLPYGGARRFHWYDSPGEFVDGGVCTSPENEFVPDLNGEVTVIPPARRP